MDTVANPPTARRGADRRQRTTFVLAERRSGFDRRQQGGFARAAMALRDSPATLLVLLAAANVMNVIDQLATTQALSAGFSEGNPVMAALISHDPRLAAVLKVLAILLVSAGIWRLRRYRLILQVAVLMFALFAGVLVLHVYGAALYY